jgi:hypothetical protein
LHTRATIVERQVYDHNAVMSCVSGLIWDALFSQKLIHEIRLTFRKGDSRSSIKIRTEVRVAEPFNSVPVPSGKKRSNSEA